MKKKQFILLFLAATFFIGCSKDDDSTPANSVVDISGNWGLTAYHFEGTRRILNDTEVDIINFNATAWDIDVNTIFTDTPNDYSAIGIYNLDINVIDENGDEFYFANTLEIHDLGTWSRTNSFLGITVDGVLAQGSISELNETTLKFAVSSSSTETDENNQSVSINRTDVYTYTRQ